MFYAHSNKSDDRSDWEPLADHLNRVADLARRFGAPLKIAAAARLAGLLHDIGKYHPAFQARLNGARDRVDHSTAGAAAIMRVARTSDERAIAWLIAQGIAGHHAGLPDRNGADLANLCARLDGFDFGRLGGDWSDFVPDTLQEIGFGLDWRSPKHEAANRLAMLGRMIFSCLVDADFLETERYYVERGERAKDRDWPSLAECLPSFQAGFQAKIDGFGEPKSEMARHRAAILSTVRERAVSLEPGLFTLDVPTGGGKTLASLGFALDHAATWGHRRIIYGIPFTSIVDQTAEVFREVLGAEAILEHHSAVEDEQPERDVKKADTDEFGRDKMRLAMENWAAPVVITTHVQLFESLFAARTSRARKLHNIAGSVIVLDEAQVLPKPLLAPTVRAIDALARDWGCSIVLCTATQPAFDARRFDTHKLGRRHPLALDLEGRELAPDPDTLHRTFVRNRLIQAGEMDDDALVSALKDEPQALVIVNSRAHALALFRLAQAEKLDGLVHLTTRQCAAHRKAILKDVRARLKPADEGGGQPCRLIATSLIEAGVDVDFPKAWRAEAGLDQIVQAAGRVNREMRRPPETSTVTVFRPKESKPPREIKALAEAMARTVQQHDDLFSREAIQTYFDEVYWQTGVEGLDAAPLRDLRDGETRGILTQMSYTKVQGVDIAYRTIAERYRMIETGMLPVIVVLDDVAKGAVDKLSLANIPSGALARALQPYIVQVPPRARALLVANQHVAFAAQDIRGDQFAVLKTPSLYDEKVGLVWENADYAAIEGLVI
ncbi:CRISPR-associated helicase/endonuclease Cas3 [Consotaella salsifontis]|uniref:CRISPR-associated helicase, Cas3 family n=1 Tax=Consotaella salsifontis TaxID=1365950 RepID=A0A1T4L5L3_9HYPH|nr:CRISPR-associated helicase/endonuclease Cas3 [Consotaella salsifontis]SJZ49918.1 CRISPR-associated helicase, Cas3 family [Consotaella salsifontis]